MNISFDISTKGYIVSDFFVHSKKIRIGHSSSYGDKFQELLSNFFYIYQIIKDKDGLYPPDYSFELLWNDDCVTYNWVVSVRTSESIIIISIFELSDEYSGSKPIRELLNERIEAESLFCDLFLSLDRLFKEFGLIGYKKNWDVGNFPIGEYLTLKADNNNIRINNQTITLEGDEWKEKILLEDELKVLLS